MSTGTLKNISHKYCPRFGQIAVEMGFITEAQLKEALCCQIDEELSGQGHRLLGAVLFSKKWMTGDQIEQVLNTLLKRMRLDDADNGNTRTG